MPLVVCLCVTYTFVQGGHVRVDLIYSGISFRAKKVVDMVGSLIFMMPAAVLTWMYGWFFLWRHLIVPKPSASDTPRPAGDEIPRPALERRDHRLQPQRVQTPTSCSRSCWSLFAGLVFLHAIAFFYRSFLEFVEGQGSENKYLDKDSLGEGEEAYEGTH